MQVATSVGPDYKSENGNGPPPRLAFLTAMPRSVHRGSGCSVGIHTLATGIAASGGRVEIIRPALRSGSFLIDRYVYNQALRFRRVWNHDAIVGFDLDGFAMTGGVRVPRIASIKGVLGDAVAFERGSSRATMALQARWEAEHARNADLVITISTYCKSRLQELYGVRGPVAVVPELIDLETWNRLFRENQASRRDDHFTVLCVCRFYPRKRVSVLLRAANILRSQIPGLRIRIVGGGPEAASLHWLCRELRLDGIVTWVGEAPRHELAREYNRADLFCLPSVQEGFGIVFLEAMAAGKPIVATRSAAIPEVVKHGILVEPEKAGALAEGIYRLWADPQLRSNIQKLQREDVEQYEMGRVAQRFLREVGKVTSQ
jgi:glycosyltransferase involved in cell wall biosynthesis